VAVDINLTPTAQMPPVTTETQGTGTTTGTTKGEGTSGILPSLAADQAAKADVAQTQATAAAQSAVGDALATEANAKAAAADAEAVQQAAAAEESSRVRDAYLARIAKADAAAAAQEQKIKDFQFHDYWGSMSTGHKIGAKIQMAFGAFAAGMLGGPNMALQKIQRDIDRDFEMQKMQLASREKIASMQRAGVQDLYGAMQHDLAALEVKHAAAYKAVAAKAQAEATRAGVPLAQAQNNVVTQGLLQKATEKDLAAKQRYEQQFHQDEQKTAQQQRHAETQVTSAKTGAGGGVEADKNAANFAVLKEHGTWIANEMPKLSAEDIKAVNQVMASEDFLQGDGTVKTAINAAAAKLGLDPETGISSTAKEYLDRVRRAAEGLGRVQSGAAIGTVENKRFVASLMPKVSDTPEDLTKRAQRIADDIKSRGAFMERAPRNAAGAAAAPADKQALKAKVLRAAAWIEQHPGDPRIPAARRAIANINMQLGAQ
jgi:hypothetical protein